MKIQSFTQSLISVLVFALILNLFACSTNNDNDPQEKMLDSLSASEAQNIYDILSDYKGIECFFTYSEHPQIKEFEQRLFGDFLGNNATADIIVSMIELYPALINTGNSFAKSGSGGKEDPIKNYFAHETIAEMESKGPVPDLVSNLGVITENILAVENKKIVPFFNYLDKLDKQGERAPEAKNTIDYILEILLNVINYLDTLKEEDVNIFMHFLISDLQEMNTCEEGKFDFTDSEEMLQKFSTKAPLGLIQILEGLKSLFYDEQLKTLCAEFLHKLGTFLGEEQVFLELKTLLENIDKKYDSKNLGEILDRIWDKGPIIGPVVEKMGIDLYGKDGKQDRALRELLMQPQIINETLETMYQFQEEGFGFDRIDDQLIKMTHTDPFCFDQKGEGQYGNGDFYAPEDTQISYKNYSTFQGLINFLARWNVPFNLTSNVLYEKEASQPTKKLIQSIVPGADKLSVSSFIWADMYEKDPDSYMGNGSPIKEKKGYGMMLDGVYVAPTCPALVTMANLPLFLMGEATYHGPYDNIYDNLKWEFYERNHYIIIDLVQLSPHVPLLKNTVLPFFNLMGIQSLPIIAVKVKGANGIIHLELQDLIKNLPVAMTNEFNKIGMPKWMANIVTGLLIDLFPMATHVEKTNRVYILPQDIRDVATLVWALCYFDPDAFHLDRFESLDEPETYRYFYDPRSYTYENNRDTANPLWNLLGALCVSSYRIYKDTVDDYSSSLKEVPDRQQAAIEAFGLIYPFSYIHNTAVPLTETPTESSIYSNSDENSVPLLKLLHPLLGMESTGAMDTLFELLATLGKPELKPGRKKILQGLSKIVQTIETDSQSPYTIAFEILKITQKSETDPRRWNAFKLLLEAGYQIFDDDSPYEIVEDIIHFVDYLTGVDISDEEWRLASEGIVEVIGNTAEAKAFTRASIQISTILSKLDSMHIWGDTINAMQEALKEDGFLSYVLRGIEKDPEVPWSDVIEDSNRFLQSELMKSYEEDSFWKDIYYFLKFLSESIEIENK